MKKETAIVVEVMVPPRTEELLRGMAKNGILGDTVEEVILHMLRQYLWDKAVTWKTEGKP